MTIDYKVLGTAMQGGLVGVLAGRVFEGGMASPYWWGCIVFVALASAIQDIGR